MTAMDGGERLDEGPAALNSMLERPHADGRARPLEEIFPLRGDAGRAHLMHETWRAFADGMTGKVAAAFGDGRSAGYRLFRRRGRPQFFPHARRDAHKL